MHRHFIVVAIAVMVIAISFILWATAHSRSVDSSAKTSESVRVLAPVPAPISAVSAVVPVVIANPQTPHRHFDGFLAVFVDPTAGPQRLPPDLSARLTAVVAPEEFAAVEGILLDPKEDDTIRNEAANLLRRSQSRSLQSHLITILDRSGDNPRFRSFATQHLGISLAEDNPSTAPLVAQRLREALRDRDLPVRREALLALSRNHDDSVNEILLKGLDSKEWFDARDLIVRLIYQSNMDGRLGDIRKLLNDGNESVSIAAIYVLGEWRDEGSRGPLKTLSRSSSQRISSAALIALRKIEEQSSGNRIPASRDNP